MNENDIFEDMAAQLRDVEVPEDVEDLSGLSSLQLSQRLHALDDALMEMRQLVALNPSEEARHLHSRRGAIVVELRRRGAL